MNIRCWFRHKWEDMGPSVRGGTVFKCTRCPKTKHNPEKTRGVSPLPEIQKSLMEWDRSSRVKDRCTARPGALNDGDDEQCLLDMDLIKTIWETPWIDPSYTLWDRVLGAGNIFTIDKLSGLQYVELDPITIKVPYATGQRVQVVVTADIDGQGIHITWKPSTKEESDPGTSWSKPVPVKTRCLMCGGPLLFWERDRCSKCRTPKYDEIKPGAYVKRLTSGHDL